MEQDKDKANSEVHLVFREEVNEEDGVRFVNIFLEAPGREITPKVARSEDVTLAEAWGFDMLEFIHNYLREIVGSQTMPGVMLKMPKKKDMN